MERITKAKILKDLIQSQVDQEIIVLDATIKGTWERVTIKRADTGMEIASFNVDQVFDSPAAKVVTDIVESIQRALM